MTGPQMQRFAFPIALAIGLSPLAAHAQNPVPSTSPGCGVLKDVTTCNWAAFRHVLASAHIIAVEHGPIDRFTGRQLAELVTRLGKTVAGPGHPGDLTFVIVPAEPHGIDVGPADQPILTLQIFSGPTSQGQLLWFETLRGTPDRPKATDVHSVIEQFEARLTRPQ